MIIKYCDFKIAIVYQLFKTTIKSYYLTNL